MEFSDSLDVGCWSFAQAATVTGNLTDISVQPLTTKMLFTPTTNLLVTGSGLSAGPPKMITTSSGAFTLDLEAGDYTVSLPLITWRAPFRISVFATNGTVNITNLLSPPTTYTYTNFLATAPLHVNTTRVTVWSANGSLTLLDSPTTLPAGVLAAANVITAEAFGTSSDPARISRHHFHTQMDTGPQTLHRQLHRHRSHPLRTVADHAAMIVAAEVTRL